MWWTTLRSRSILRVERVFPAYFRKNWNEFARRKLFIREKELNVCTLMPGRLFSGQRAFVSPHPRRAEFCAQIRVLASEKRALIAIRSSSGQTGSGCSSKPLVTYWITPCPARQAGPTWPTSRSRPKNVKWASDRMMVGRPFCVSARHEQSAQRQPYHIHSQPNVAPWMNGSPLTSIVGTRWPATNGGAALKLSPANATWFMYRNM